MSALEDANEELLGQIAATRQKLAQFNALETALIDREEDLKAAEEDEHHAKVMCLDLKEALSKSEEGAEVRLPRTGSCLQTLRPIH